MTIEALYAGLVAVCVFFAALFSSACVAIVLWRCSRGIMERWRKLGRFDKAAAVAALCVAVAFGGTKPHPVQNAGADEGIALVAVAVEYDATNNLTAVEVLFVGHNVTTATPVSVRNGEKENWRELEKIGATVTTDLATNILSFAASGNVTTNRYWWVGTETPAVIIETAGITITHFAASSSSVEIMWTCDDPQAVEYVIQRRRKGAAQWETVGVTTSLAFVYVGFTVGETWEWRVTSTYMEGD